MDNEVRILHCENGAERLDRYLTEAIPELSRRRARELIEAGKVTYAGQTDLKPSLGLPPGAELQVHVPPQAPERNPLSAQNIALDILYDDEDIVVVNKPAGLVVHPAPGHSDDTLVNALLYHYGHINDPSNDRPGIVHRLDRYTSGVMVAALNTVSLRDLRGQFKDRVVEKVYLALVHGHPPADQGIIDVPLARHPQLRQQMTTMPGGKPSRTRYILRQRFKQFSLLDVYPETGRTHQIRVHLSWLRNPIVGDVIYGRRRTKMHMPVTRQCLHAQRLTLTHPRTRERLTFEAPLPDDFEAVLAWLNHTG